MKLLSVIIFVFISIALHAQSDSLSTVQTIDSTQVYSDTLSFVEQAQEMKEQANFNASSSSSDTIPYLKPYQVAIPCALIVQGIWIQGYNGLYSSQKVREDVQHWFPNFNTSIDNYLQYVPTVAAYGAGFVPGVKPAHQHGRRLWLMVQSQVLTSVTVSLMKHYIPVMRPDGSNNNSFPSGHTAQAFMGATFYEMEYPHQMKAMKVAMYALAGLTGALRVANDRHWSSDVLVGAGIGMLSVRFLFWADHKMQKR